MKSRLFLILTLMFLGIGMIYGFLQKEQKKEKEQDTQTTVIQKPDAVAFLIEKINTPVKGQIITPKTTKELRAWFSEATENSVPRIFVTKLPDDFAIEGDKDLFSNVISALILRENERVFKERAVLILLKNKLLRGEQWTGSETAFFDDLVDRYDSRSRKTISAKLEDLQLKLDTIPPMTAVVQAAEATDWGTKNLSSPFEQTGWLDSKTYAPIPFDSWVDATESYALEMNGMPPLESWRVMRSNLRGQGYENIGFRVLRWMSDYKQEDILYKERLHKRAEELGYEIPDSLSFQKEQDLGFEKGTLSINNKKFSVEIAKTKEQLEHGLMFRNRLDDGNGMIFLYEPPRISGVWMKNTFIPLDVIFFDEKDKVVSILEKLNPLDETPHMVKQAVKGFIELPAGSVQKYQIKIGDKIHF